MAELLSIKNQSDFPINKTNEEHIVLTKNEDLYIEKLETISEGIIEDAVPLIIDYINTDPDIPEFTPDTELNFNNFTGEGTETNPYQIWNDIMFKNFRDKVNAGAADTTETIYFKQMKDIKITVADNEYWRPVGLYVNNAVYDDGTTQHSFTYGTSNCNLQYDGNEHNFTFKLNKSINKEYLFYCFELDKTYTYNDNCSFQFIDPSSIISIFNNSNIIIKNTKFYNCNIDFVETNGLSKLYFYGIINSKSITNMHLYNLKVNMILLDTVGIMQLISCNQNIENCNIENIKINTNKPTTFILLYSSQSIKNIRTDGFVFVNNAQFILLSAANNIEVINNYATIKTGFGITLLAASNIKKANNYGNMSVFNNTTSTGNIWMTFCNTNNPVLNCINLGHWVGNVLSNVTLKTGCKNDILDFNPSVDIGSNNYGSFEKVVIT
jgi:hypothetical protein